MSAAVSVRGLSKAYKIRRSGGRAPYRTLQDEILGWLRRENRSAADTRDETVWALDDVSFDIERGEAVGIIGRNGAGKSTLLKILSRISEPSRGYADVFGRVGALLEVGTGFHPELTGRENIYLNGTILGMLRAEINRQFDQIVEFSGVGRFLDTPVKYYSSGMYTRLAFSVAAHLEPEILVVDEVLAVGDAEFQKKCLGKMGSIAQHGRTVLFVSHNMTAVETLCRRAIWIDRGQVRMTGASGDVIAQYQQAASQEVVERVWNDLDTAPGNERVRIRSARVQARGGGATIDVLTPFTIELEYWNLVPDARLNLSLFLYNAHNVLVFNVAPIHEPVWHGKPFPCGLYRTSCEVPGELLNNGVHNVSILVVENQARVVYKADELLTFDVRDSAEARGDWHGQWPGTIRPNLTWRTELLERPAQEEAIVKSSV